MVSTVGILLHIVGMLLVIGFWLWYALDKLQNNWKLWLLFGVMLLSVLFAALTTVPSVALVFAGLSVVIPTLVLLTVGIFLLGSALLRGIQATSPLLVVILVSAIVALAVSILMIQNAQVS